jgi:O-antigen/teichoic acid export membrane protein
LTVAATLEERDKTWLLLNDLKDSASFGLHLVKHRQKKFPLEQAARIRWNSLFSLLSSGIRLLTNVLLFLGIARFYGPEAFGQFTTAHTLSALFLLLADFGLDLLFTTEVARQPANADRLFRSFASVKLLFVSVALMGMWLIPIAHDFSEATRWLIYVFSLGVAFNALTNFFFALFKGFEQLQYETRVSFIENVALLISLVLLGILHAPIGLFAAVFTGTRALGFIIAAITAVRFVRLRAFNITTTEWKEVVRQGWVFGVHLLFGTLYFQLDTVLLALWKDDHTVGIYQAVMKLVALVLVLPDVAINALLPVLSRFHHEDQMRWLRLGRLLNKTLFLLGLPIALIFFVYAEHVIHFVYGGTDFEEAIPVLRVFAAVVLVRFGVETFALMLTTSRQQKARMAVVVLAAILNYLLNAFAIPRYGVLGAAVVSLATNIFAGAGYMFATRQSFFKMAFDLRGVVPLVVTLLLAAVLWQVKFLSLFYVAPVLLALYGFVFYFAGYTRDERNLVFAMGKNATYA